MTDFDLPPLRPAALRDADVYNALRALRRRRAVRAARTTATLAAAVATAVTLSAGGPPGTTSTVSPTTDLATGTVSTEEPVARTSRPPRPPRATKPRRTTTALPRLVAVPTGRATAATHEPSPDPGVERTRKPDGYVVDNPETTYSFHDEPATYAYVAGAAPANCRTEDARLASWSRSDPDADSKMELAKDFCSSLTGPATVVAGKEATLRYRVCRSGASGVTSHTLTRSAKVWFEAWWAPRDGRPGGSQWFGETDAAPRQIVVEPGDCAQWTFRYAAMKEGNEHGPMDPGAYKIVVNWIAREFQPNCPSGPSCPTTLIDVVKK